MGCEGCELVKGRGREGASVRPTCYAKLQTDRWAGNKGWPEIFRKASDFHGSTQKNAQLG